MTPQTQTVIAMTFRDETDRTGEHTITNRLAEFARLTDAKPTAARKDEELDWEKLDGYF